MCKRLIPINDLLIRDLLGKIAQAQAEIRNWITTTDIEWTSRDQVVDTLEAARQTLEAARVEQVRSVLKKKEEMPYVEV